MYKKFDFQTVCNTNTKFFDNLKMLYKKQGFDNLKDFLKTQFLIGNSLYFLDFGEIYFRIQKNSSNTIFYDEKEKIQLTVNEENLIKMYSILKDDKKISKIKADNKTILETLLEEFVSDSFLKDILGKNFVVYDIETVGNINNIKSTKFYMGYCYISDKKEYRYIDQQNLGKFVEFLIGFDGWIVGYNNINFDNPVCIYSSEQDPKFIETLNQKSLDLFLFIWNLTGKRIGLDKVATALIGEGKTLSSGVEGEGLLKEYEKTKDEKLLKKVKNYCKNDVKITLGVMLYLLKYKHIFIDDKDYYYDINDFINLSNKPKEDKKTNKTKENGLSLF